MDLTEELTSGPLSAELQPLIEQSDYAGILAALNRKDIEAYGNLSVHNVKRYISLIGLRLPILDSTQPSCREFNLALDDFKETGFDLATPQILGKITAVLDDLVAETLIPDFTEEHKTALLSFGIKMISRAEQLGINPTIRDISETIFADDGTRKI